MSPFIRFAPQKIDQINILLIFVSVIIAVLIPFELFLFSYAVLGPLHYLTEISWLHQKKYFLAIPEEGQKKIFPAFVIIFAAVVSIGMVKLMNGEPTKVAISTVTLYVFFISLILIVFKKNSIRIGAVALLTLVCVSMNMERETLTCTDMISGNSVSVSNTGHGTEMQEFIRTNCRDIDKDGLYKQDVDFKLDYTNPFWVMLFGTYIPTLIHVYIFTLFFMLYGALKSRSLYGKIAVAALLLAGIFLLFVPLSISYNISGYALKTYDGIFAKVNKAFIKDFHYDSFAANIYTSKSGLMLARFIAFAYTYHYLNWFSKTSIIQWHKMPKLNLAVVLVLWIAAIALYAVNFKLGFTTLLFLSFMHVYLEFPLNLHSMKGIWEYLFAKKTIQEPKMAK